MRSAIRPITPADASAAKARRVPDVVLTAFNEAIVAVWDGRRARVLQTDVVQRIRNHLLVAAPREAVDGVIERLFKDGDMDVEPIYRAAGWAVVYDKTQTDGEDWFEFTRKAKAK